MLTLPPASGTTILASTGTQIFGLLMILDAALLVGGRNLHLINKNVPFVIYMKELALFAIMKIVFKHFM